MQQHDDPPTLPDLLRPGLRLVFIGINPGLYSARRGHYFARTTNRFWPALSRSVLSLSVRTALGFDRLGPEHDAVLPDFGFGFTDLAKRPTSNAGGLRPVEFMEGAQALCERLRACQPLTACFHGVTAFRPFLRHALAVEERGLALGEQPWSVGNTRLFMVPNPSPANAHFTLAAQVAWDDALADLLER